MENRPQYSIVAPIYNEEGNIPQLYARISEVMNSTEESWELILVNDGSRDRSLELIMELAQTDPQVKVVNFARNFGHQIAVTAGGEDLAAIVDAITKRLDDSNALVRYTAASTLIGLGRSSLHAADLTRLIAKFEAMSSDDDADVRQLVGDGLTGLRTRLDQLQSAAGGGGSASSSSPASQAKRWYVVGVDEVLVDVEVNGTAELAK